MKYNACIQLLPWVTHRAPAMRTRLHTTPRIDYGIRKRMNVATYIPVGPTSSSLARPPIALGPYFACSGIIFELHEFNWAKRKYKGVRPSPDKRFSGPISSADERKAIVSFCANMGSLQNSSRNRGNSNGPWAFRGPLRTAFVHLSRLRKNSNFCHSVHGEPRRAAR